MRKTYTVLNRKSYAKANRIEFIHEISIIGAKVYNLNADKKSLWRRIRKETK